MPRSGAHRGAHGLVNLFWHVGCGCRYFWRTVWDSARGVMWGLLLGKFSLLFSSLFFFAPFLEFSTEGLLFA